MDTECVRCGAIITNDLVLAKPDFVSYVTDKIHEEVARELMQRIDDGNDYIIQRNDKVDENEYLCEKELSTIIQVAKLVRCEDCKYAEVVKDSIAMYECPFHPGVIWPFDSYCSFAERKVQQNEGK